MPDAGLAGAGGERPAARGPRGGPHFSRKFPTAHDEALGRLSELRAALRSRGLSLLLDLAAEVASSMAVEAPAPALLARRYLLVELERDTPAGVVRLILDRAQELGTQVVLAHPERCRAVRDHLRLIDGARERGALIQVVAPSLVGRWGKGASVAAWQLVQTGRADLLASDSHRGRPGSQNLSASVAQLARHVPPWRIVEMTITGPSKLVRNSAAR